MDITASILAENDLKNRREFLDRRQESEEFASSVIEDIEYFIEDIWREGQYLDFDWASLELQKNQMGYVYCGVLLEHIFRYKLWHRDRKFSSPKEFCEKLMGRSLAYAKRLIKAAKVCVELIRAGFAQLPLCEAQARPLTKLEAWPNALNPEESPLCQKWEEIIEAANNQPITAEFIKQIVEGDSGEKKKPIRVKRTTFDKLLERANSRGFATVDEFLEAIAEGRELPEEPEPPEPLPTVKPELPPPPEELQVSWLEKLRDRFTAIEGFLTPNEIEQAKTTINKYINFVWFELQVFKPSGENRLCNSS